MKLKSEVTEGQPKGNGNSLPQVRSLVRYTETNWTENGQKDGTPRVGRSDYSLLISRKKKGGSSSKTKSIDLIPDVYLLQKFR